jgi:prepilin-type N-terminal cleavage/methylation domain-containing protein
MRHGFTLLELMMVVALAAIVMGLAVPAIQGTLGLSGRRGGVSVAVNLVEQARLAAVENGVRTYLVFAPTNSDTEVRFNSLVIMREKKPGESMAGSHVPMTRWIRLPQGVFYDGLSNMVSVTMTNFPRLQGASTTGPLRALQFDRFGRLFPRTGSMPTFRVGEGVVSRQGPVWRVVFKGKNYETISVQRLTGRVSAASP